VVKIMQLLHMQLSSASCYFLSLYPDIALSTLLLNTLSVCLSLKLTDQVLHLYKARGKITLLCIFIFNFYWDLFNKLTIFQPCNVDCRMIDWSRIEKDSEGSRYGLIKLLSHHFLEENVFMYGCCMCYMSSVKSLDMNMH
jgi:hypothetical protein